VIKKNNMKNLKFLFLNLFILVICFQSCEEKQLESFDYHTYSDGKLILEKDLQILENVLGHLNSVENINNLSYPEQINHAYLYAVENNLEFNSNAALNSIESASKEGDNTHSSSSFTIEEHKKVKEIIKNDFSDLTLSAELENYKTELELRATIDNADEIIRIVNTIRLMQFMIQSPESRKYLGTGENSELQYRGDCENAIGITVFGGLLCALNPWACLVPIGGAIFTYLDCFGDDDDTDPCASSSDPCCGISCSLSYHCVNGTCVPDPNYQGCPNIPCPPAHSCIGGMCMPW